MNGQLQPATPASFPMQKAENRKRMPSWVLFQHCSGTGADLFKPVASAVAPGIPRVALHPLGCALHAPVILPRSPPSRCHSAVSIQHSPQLCLQLEWVLSAPGGLARLGGSTFSIKYVARRSRNSSSQVYGKILHGDFYYTVFEFWRLAAIYLKGFGGMGAVDSRFGSDRGHAPHLAIVGWLVLPELTQILLSEIVWFCLCFPFRNPRRRLPLKYIFPPFSLLI